MPGRPPNQARTDARAAGERTYTDLTACECGGFVRYTSNASCVACSIEKAKQRYAGLDESAKAEWARRDHERYLNRKAKSPHPDRGPGRPWPKREEPPDGDTPMDPIERELAEDFEREERTKDFDPDLGF